MAGRVLIIAGSDSSGGAGIQADIKTVTMLGGYAATALTALTAQNTLGVHGIHAVPPDFIQQQIKTALDDIGADVIKIGMLGDSTTIKAVREAIEPAVLSGVPLVLDPVMVAKGGAALLAEEAVATLRVELLPLAFVATPNLNEAAKLSGLEVGDRAERLVAAKAIQALGCPNVFITGGALEGDSLLDILLCASKSANYFTHPRKNTKHTHGTGCTIASAVATGLAQGLPLLESVERAIGFVQKAIEAAPGFGAGHGPLGHYLVR